MDWKMTWADKIRQFLLLPPSKAEMQRRLEYVSNGGNWPPLPRAFPLPPAPPPPPRNP